MVKMPACRAVWYGFESRSDRWRSSMVEHLTENQGVKSSILFVDKARLAQLVEQRTFNPVVIGSIPIPGIFY